MSDMITVKDMCLWYGEHQALKDVNIHIFQGLMVAIPQAHIFNRDNTHKLLLFAKCFCTKVAAKLIRTVRTIRMAAMAKATPNSPCSFA